MLGSLMSWVTAVAGQEHHGIPGRDLLACHEVGEDASEALATGDLPSVEGSLGRLDVTDGGDMELTVSQECLNDRHSFGREDDGE